MVEVADEGALIGARQEAGAPELGPLKDGGGADDHEGRQVLVLRPQAVDEPRAEARPREGLLARVHLESRPGVVDVVGDHRADHAEVVDVARQAGQQLAHLGPALAVFGELPRRGQQVAGLGALELRLLEGERLAVHRGQLRLGIEQVDVRRPAGHVEEDAPLRGRAMVRGADGVGVGRAVGSRQPRLATGPPAGPRAPPGQSRYRLATRKSRREGFGCSHMGMILAGQTAQTQAQSTYTNSLLQSKRWARPGQSASARGLPGRNRNARQTSRSSWRAALPNRSW